MYTRYNAVHSFWSSNTRAMALRDIPFEVEFIEKVLLPNSLTYTQRCWDRCEINFDCRKLPGCGYCRRQSAKSSFKRCLTPR